MRPLAVALSPLFCAALAVASSTAYAAGQGDAEAPAPPPLPSVEGDAIPATPQPPPPPAPPPAAFPRPPGYVARVPALPSQGEGAPPPSAVPGQPSGRDGAAQAADGPAPVTKFLHGFRVGYGLTLNHDTKVESLRGESLADRTGMRSPHHFLIGYEAFYRLVGHSWLNVILVGNGMIAGLEQSKFFPSGNFLLGAELANSFQVGAGINVSPVRGSEAHMIIAAGWTPRVGSFYVPVHGFFIHDIDGVHRTGMTTGVTW